MSVVVSQQNINTYVDYFENKRFSKRFHSPKTMCLIARLTYRK